MERKENEGAFIAKIESRKKEGEGQQPRRY
jgi:hypothetical protein